MRRPSGNDLLIATSVQGEPLILTKEQRSRHLYVTGSTGSGKSKFLEYLIRQDIMNWRKSECGLLLLDPHGAIYDGLMSWHARTSYIYDDRPVIPIDLRRDDWVVAYNLLRKREKVAASVVTDNLVDALAYVWGAGGMDATPRLARNMATVFQTLYEHGLTLAEVLKVLEFGSHEFRAQLARGTKNEAARGDLLRLNTLKPSDYLMETESTSIGFSGSCGMNPCAPLLVRPRYRLISRRPLPKEPLCWCRLQPKAGRFPKRTPAPLPRSCSPIFGPPPKSAREPTPNPSTSTSTSSSASSRPQLLKILTRLGALVCTLRSRSSTPHNSSRRAGNTGRGSMNPSWRMRGARLCSASPSGTGISHPLRTGSTPAPMTPLASSTNFTAPRSWVIPKRLGESPRAERRGERQGARQVLLLNPMQRSTGTSQVATSTDTTTRGDSESESESESVSEVPVFIPIFGTELSSVQFYSLEEQSFQAERRIMMQKDRHATARFLGMHAPVELRTPELPSRPGNEESVEAYRQEQLAKWPFVLSSEEAQARLEKRSATIALPSIAPETEPVSYKRRVSSRARMKAHVGNKEDTPGD